MADETTSKIGMEVAVQPKVDEVATNQAVKQLETAFTRKPVTVKLKSSGSKALLSDLKDKGGYWWKDVDLGQRSAKSQLKAMRDALQLSEHDFEILGSRDVKHAGQKKLLQERYDEFKRYQSLVDKKEADSVRKSKDKQAKKLSLETQRARNAINLEAALEKQRAKYALSDERKAQQRAEREARAEIEAAETAQKHRLSVAAKYDSARAQAQRLLRFQNQDYDWMPEIQPATIEDMRSLIDSLQLSEQEQTLARMSVKADYLTEEERDQIQAAQDKLKYLKQQERILDKMMKAEAKVGGDGRGILSKAGGFFGNAFKSLLKFPADVMRRAYRNIVRDAARELLALAKEGVQILTDWDRNFGNNTSRAAETMDYLSSKWFELKKSVGAAAMPIIQILQPAIEKVVDLVITAVNWINQLARAFQGETTYMKATARVVSKTTAAAKELKKVLFGFDELNILPDENGSGAASSVMPYDYDVTDIERKVLETVQMLREKWAKFKAWWKESIGDPFRRIWGSIKDDAVNAWDQMKESWSELKEWWNRYITIPLSEAWDSIKTDFTEAWAQMKESWGELKAWWNEYITRPLKDAWNSVKTDFENATTQMKESWESFKQRWEGVLDAIKKPFQDAFEGIRSWILEHPWLAKLLGVEPGTFDTTINVGVQFWTDTQLSNDTKKLMNLLDMNVLDSAGRTTVQAEIRDNLALNGDPNSILFRNSLRGYASGGTIANKGSLILANERGPEVIANMGNATGIMNTNQMQAAIVNGNSVVVSALYDIANEIVRTVQNKSTDVYLDGNKVGQSVSKYQQNRLKATGLPV